MTADGFVVYWQPGCTSCLKTKEFLARHGVGFESVNVRAAPDAMRHLAALGARSVPVIVRGSDWTYGQDLDEVARFVGVEVARERLPPAMLVQRLLQLQDAVRRHTAQLTDAALETLLPGRADRAGADLAYHVPMIVAAFLEAAGGGRLTVDFFERRPSGAGRERAALLAVQQAAAASFRSWWRRSAEVLPETLDTYYGRHPLAPVLERTAWHVAQHARQLESLLRHAGVEPDGALGAAELAGLPLPEAVWDAETGTAG